MLLLAWESLTAPPTAVNFVPLLQRPHPVMAMGNHFRLRQTLAVDGHTSSWPDPIVRCSGQAGFILMAFPWLFSLHEHSGLCPFLLPAGDERTVEAVMRSRYHGDITFCKCSFWCLAVVLLLDGFTFFPL